MYKEYVRKIFVSRVYSTEIVKWSLSEVMCRACRIDYGRPIEICLSNFSTVLTIFFFSKTPLASLGFIRVLAVAVDLNCFVYRDISNRWNHISLERIF